MNRFFFSLVVMCFCFGFSLNAQKTYTLITAISNYDQNKRPECGDLPMTTETAKVLKVILEKQSSSIAMLTGRNANHDNFLAKLRSLCAAAGPKDRVIIYYGGHGSPGSLCAWDKDVQFSEIFPIFRRSKASQIICFIESCYSGSAITDAEKYNWNTNNCPNLVMFMSSRPNEPSYGDGIMTASGIFGKALQNGLRGMCDIDKNRDITVLELFKYIHAYVKKRTYSNQHPQLITSPDNYNKKVISW